MKPFLGLAILMIVALVGTLVSQIGTLGASGKHRIERTMMRPQAQVYDALEHYLKGATYEIADYGTFGEPVTVHMQRTPRERLVLTLKMPDEVLLQIDARVKPGKTAQDTDVEIDYIGARFAWRLKKGVETERLERLIGEDIERALDNIADAIQPESFSVHSIVKRTIEARYGKQR